MLGDCERMRGWLMEFLLLLLLCQVSTSTNSTSIPVLFWHGISEE